MRQHLPTAQHHFRGQLPPRLKLHLFRDVASLAALSVLCPVLGQIQFAVRQGDRALGCVNEKFGDLTLLFLAQAPTPLPLRADGMWARLWKPAAIQNENAIRAAKFRSNSATHFVPELSVLPPACPNKMLQGPSFVSSIDGNRF